MRAPGLRRAGRRTVCQRLEEEEVAAVTSSAKDPRRGGPLSAEVLGLDRLLPPGGREAFALSLRTARFRDWIERIGQGCPVGRSSSSDRITTQRSPS